MLQRQKQTTVRMLILFIIVFVGYGFGLGLLLSWRNEPKWRDNGWTPRAFENTAEFEQAWVQSNVFIEPQHDGNILLTATDAGAFIIGSVEIDQRPSIIKFSLQSGEVEWVAFDNRSFFGPTLSTMATDANLVFVGFASYQKIDGDTTSGASKIIAYDAETEESVWETLIGGARSITTIAVTNSSLSVDGNFSSNFYLLNAHTGEIVDASEKEDGFTVSISNEILVKRVLASDLQAINKFNQTVIWEQKLPRVLIQPPFLLEGVLLLRTGTYSGQVIAIDQTNGNIMWIYEDAASNIAVANEVIYFLTEDARLLAVDPKTGEVLRTLVFSPAPLSDVVNSGFYVAANEDIVLIYFGDSQELVAFRDLMQ